MSDNTGTRVREFYLQWSQALTDTKASRLRDAAPRGEDWLSTLTFAFAEAYHAAQSLHSPACEEGVCKQCKDEEQSNLGAPGAGQAGSRDDSRLLLMRDALVVGNYGEAYNQLYHYVDAGRGLFDPWTTLSASPSEPKAAPEKCPTCGSSDKYGRIVAWAGLKAVWCSDPFHKAGSPDAR
jgi:hypothetical protein